MNDKDAPIFTIECDVCTPPMDAVRFLALLTIRLDNITDNGRKELFGGFKGFGKMRVEVYYDETKASWEK
jgi:hypothetical protein